ncbi:MAG: hypothetical protein GC201_13670 [Alphaproteobacteria bacterium]|nr:hypothetical protein [Alphaproteobacteria bacterium]
MISPSLTKCLLAGGALAMAIAAGPVHAAPQPRSCAVAKFQINNKGAYSIVRIYVKQFDSDGYETKVAALGDVGTDITAGTSRTFDLSKKPGIVKKREIWVSYDVSNVSSPETKSCRKDGTRLYYRSDGVTWKLKGKGTTTKNNRCQFDGDNKCVDPASLDAAAASPPSQ